MRKAWKVTMDLVSHTAFVVYSDGEGESVPLYGSESFALLSELWTKAGWANRFSYNFSWMGRPIIQLPEDLLMVQEVIWRVRPNVIIETGVAHGGSAVFYASLFEVMGNGRVISVDIEIRPHNREALDNHPLRKRITLIERSSTAEETLTEVRAALRPDDKVMVILDSNHTKDHVAKELELYSPLVGSGSYIIATDGYMESLFDLQSGKPEWREDNPRAAVHDFLKKHPEFACDPEPTRLGVTYWPDAYLRRQ